MERRQIAYFLAVADAKSFSRAAKALHVSQSALSARVAELELELGSRVFERLAVGVALTSAGRRLLPYARNIMSAFRDAQEAMRAALPVERVAVLIGVSPAIGVTILPRLLEVTRAMRIGIDWRAQQATSLKLLELVGAGTIDVALCYIMTAGGPSGSEPLYSDDMALIGSRAVLVDEGDIPFADVTRFPLVLDPLSHASRQVVETAALREGVRLQVHAEIEPLSAKRMLVLKDRLCTIAPRHVFEPELDLGVYSARRIVKPNLPLPLFLVFGDHLDAARRAPIREAVLATIAGRN